MRLYMHNLWLWLALLMPYCTILAQEAPIATTVDAIENALDTFVPRGPGGIAVDFPVAIAPIEFDTNSTTIRPQSKAILDAYGQALTGERLQKAIIVVAGHTDAVGNAETNLLLSHRRAQAVRAYLINEYDILARRLRVEAYGEERPVDDNDTEMGKARNRRVEFIRLGWLE